METDLTPSALRMLIFDLTTGITKETLLRYEQGDLVRYYNRLLEAKKKRERLSQLYKK